MSKGNRHRERQRTHDEERFGSAPEPVRSFRDQPVADQPGDRKVGTVTKVVDPRMKGFGFIKGDDGQEYFMHRSSCQVPWEGNGQIEQGDRVAFTGTLNAKGFRALNVSRAEEERHGQEGSATQSVAHRARP